MEKIIERISNYHIVNTLIPGFIFVYLSKQFLSVDLYSENVLYNFFVFYMLGIICNRIGSIIIEPFFKFTKIIKFASYEEYVKAELKNPKIETLNTDNNFYRTMCATILLVVAERFYIYLIAASQFVASYKNEILIILTLVLFSFSYHKQTSYIKKRVDAVNRQNS